MHGIGRRAVASCVVVTALLAGLVVATGRAEARSAGAPEGGGRGALALPDAGAVLAGLRAGHPRLILTPEAVDELRQRIVTDPTSHAMYDAVKARALALLGEPPLTYTKPDGFRLLETSRAAVRRLYDLGLVWLVDGDPQVAARGWQELAAVTAFPDWNPVHFLDTAEMTHAVAIGYDWLYDALTPSQRTSVEQAIAAKGLGPARDAYAGVAPLLTSYWTAVDHNWNNVVNGGITMGALAVGDVEPALASYDAHEALTRLPAALAHYAPDGGWPEGVSYWEYATEYTGYVLTGLQTALGTDFGLSAVEGLDRTGDVPIQLTGPSGQRFNWADDGEPRFAPSVPILFWLAQRFSRPDYRDYQLAHAEPAALDVVWYRPAGGSAPAPALDRLFEGVDVASLRQSWSDPTGWWVGAKGGRPSFNHNQLDAGSFVLEAKGERWAIDLGREDYNVAGYWEQQAGGRRWTYYRSRAEGHNTLVLDPDACEDQDPYATSVVTRFRSASGVRSRSPT
ncbi:MAG: heparinase II/III family protein [Acidimicrobiales bacterium]